MLSRAFSSFLVNDIQKAREFYGKTLGLELSSGPHCYQEYNHKRAKQDAGSPHA